MQEERLRSLYTKHHEDQGYLALLAEDMPGGFSKGQISSQLRKLGLKQGAASSKHKGRKRKKEVCIDISAHLDNVRLDGLCFTPLSVILFDIMGDLQLLCPNFLCSKAMQLTH